jgi:isopenicillin-N N-acyltransferase like protein
VTPDPIPTIQVSGSHREVGRQIGEATAAAVVSRAGLVTDAELATAERYRDITAGELPWLIDELDGVAEGAGTEPLAVFAASIEELEGAATGADSSEGRCTDMVACAPATTDGHLWVAHNNDLDPSVEADLVGIEWHVPGDPVVLTFGVGPWISVGFNSAGVGLTGNEVSPNDNRVGIPRLLQVRDMLRRPTLQDALGAALHPRRASSYNTILTHRDGTVVNVEGSATDAELSGPSAAGTLAHTNHYVEQRMLSYEADPEDTRGSDLRYRRALGWLATGNITAGRLRAALSDHTGAPDALCRHAGAGSRSKTVFWVVADMTAGRLSYGRGNPCDSEEQVYEFA